MKNIKLVTLIFSVLIIACALSCKKKKGASPASSQIATVDLIQSQNIQHYRIVYDAVNNNVDSIINTGGGADTGHNGFKKFDYFPTSYRITDENNTYFDVWFNSSGVIAKVLQTDTLIMTYSGSQLSALDVRSPISAAPYYADSVTNYYWQGGDIYVVYTKTLNDTVYYNGNEGQQGDAMRIDEFLNYGQTYTKTGHIAKELSSNGNWIEQYYYQYDSQGRISQFMKVQNNNGTAPNDTLIYNYGY